MARLHCQLLEILCLGPAVALAKGMDVIHVTDYDARVLRELIGV